MVRKWNNDKIKRHTHVGLRVSCRIACIPCDIFSAHKQIPASDLKSVKTMLVPNPEGGPKVECVIMRPELVPAELPFIEGDLAAVASFLFFYVCLPECRSIPSDAKVPKSIQSQSPEVQIKIFNVGRAEPMSPHPACDPPWSVPIGKSAKK